MAHCNDPLGTLQLGGEHTKESDRAVAHYGNGRTWLHIRRFSGEPAGAHYVGERQEARVELARWHLRRGYQSSVRQRYTQ